MRLQWLTDIRPRGETLKTNRPSSSAPSQARFRPPDPTTVPRASNWGAVPMSGGVAWCRNQRGQQAEEDAPAWSVCGTDCGRSSQAGENIVCHMCGRRGLHHTGLVFRYTSDAEPVRLPHPKPPRLERQPCQARRPSADGPPLSSVLRASVTLCPVLRAPERPRATCFCPPSLASIPCTSYLAPSMDRISGHTHPLNTTPAFPINPGTLASGGAMAPIGTAPAKSVAFRCPAMPATAR